MSQVYQIDTFGSAPVTLAEMKSFLKVTSTADDTLIQALINSATEWGEKYTGREFRANTWDLLLDAFSDIGNTSKRFQVEHERFHSHNYVNSDFETERIELKRDPVDTITSIIYLNDTGGSTTVPSTDYYLKKLTQSSEILLLEDKNWPTDVLNREQTITVKFVTKSYRCTNEIRDAIRLHVSNLYTNRGDCPDSKNAAIDSGAIMIYDQFRISRV